MASSPTFVASFRINVMPASGLCLRMPLSINNARRVHIRQENMYKKEPKRTRNLQRRQINVNLNHNEAIIKIRPQINVRIRVIFRGMVIPIILQRNSTRIIHIGSPFRIKERL